MVLQDGLRPSLLANTAIAHRTRQGRPPMSESPDCVFLSVFVVSTPVLPGSARRAGLRPRQVCALMKFYPL